MKLFGAEADSILWVAEGLLLANSTTDAEAVQARKAFDTLMDGLAAERWQPNGPRTAELQRKRLIEAFAECAPGETVAASAWNRPSPGGEVASSTRGVGSPPMATKPLPRYLRPGRLARRPRQVMLDRVGRVALAALALVGAVAIVMLVLGLVGVHVVTDHFRMH